MFELDSFKVAWGFQRSHETSCTLHLVVHDPVPSPSELPLIPPSYQAAFTAFITKSRKFSPYTQLQTKHEISSCLWRSRLLLSYDFSESSRRSRNASLTWNAASIYTMKWADEQSPPLFCLPQCCGSAHTRLPTQTHPPTERSSKMKWQSPGVGGRRCDSYLI